MKIFISVLSSYLQCDHVRLSIFEWLIIGWSFVLYHNVPYRMAKLWLLIHWDLF